jgi:hypothetical protein
MNMFFAGLTTRIYTKTFRDVQDQMHDQCDFAYVLSRLMDHVYWGTRHRTDLVISDQLLESFDEISDG